MFTRRSNLHLAVCGGDKPPSEALLNKNHLLPFLLLLQTAGRDLTAVVVVVVVLVLFFLFCFSQILLLHTIAFCFRPGRPALFDFVRFDFFLCAALFFSRRSRRGRAVNRADSSALHPSVFLFVFLRAALLFRHISTPSHFFLLRLQTPLNSIFPTPFYFSATSSFLFSLPSFFPSRQATLSTPPSSTAPHPLPVCFFSVQFHSRTDYRAARVTPRRYISVNVGRAPRSLPGDNLLFFHVKMSVHWLGP